ncbi:hypothetical protein RRG08_005030 [Elysia crispata]|uniref:Uncharacterized protein n=1 Tax=Elysia crispata TaxID=231223 RepID=A0AAE1B3C4_9GAST|nr:hypothetical protein RRG08_005030 [Elysia crispata]
MPGTVATVFVIPSNNLIPIIKRMTYLGREGTSYGTVATVFVIPSNNLIPIIKRMTYLGREGTSYGWRNHARDCSHSVCDAQ